MRFLSDDRVVNTGAGARTLQVIGAGLPRCATSSLQAALESNVFCLSPCMHMAHISPHADREQLTIDAMRERDTARRHKILHTLFDGYAATTDFPGIMFLDDLMDMYPDAAIVLNQRANGRVWAQSIENSLAFFGSLPYLAACFLWKTDRLHWRIHQEASAVWYRRFGEREMFTEKMYNKYNDWVRVEAKKRGREVLEWRAGDGWAPLCKFLGKPPPTDGRSFPHLNDAATVTMVKRVLIARGLVSWAALGASIWAAWKYGPDLMEKVMSPLLTRWTSG